MGLAGSQRMLSQRIARNACFVAAEMEAQPLIDQMRSDIATFDTGVTNILEGNAELGLGPERSPIIQADYEDHILLPWGVLSLNGQALGARGAAGPTDIAQIAEPAEQVLAALEKAIFDLEEKYARGATMTAETARTTNVYAAQRMLAQRIAGQYCLVGIGLGTPDVVENLQSAFARFDTANADMTNGNFDERIMAPSPAVAETLACVRAEIEAVRPSVAAAGTAQPSADDLQTMLMASNRMMALSQVAVSALTDELSGTDATVPTCRVG